MGRFFGDEYWPTAKAWTVGLKLGRMRKNISDRFRQEGVVVFDDLSQLFEPVFVR